MTNIYYSPEAYGLEVIATLDYYEPNWSFDMVVVWRSDDGRLFYGIDSGCSCPSPFEDWKVDDLTEFNNALEMADVIKGIEYREVSDDDIDLWVAELRRKLSG